MNTWLAIVGVACTTFGLRASFIVFADPQRFPNGFRRALVFVAPAVMGALVVPGLVAPAEVIDVGLANYRLFAGVLAIAVAAWRRNATAAIATGMVALWLMQSLW